MAKKIQKNDLNVSQIQKDFNEKGKQYKEGDLIFMFNLNRTKIPTPLKMAKKIQKNDLNVSQIQKDFNEKGKQYNF